MRKLRQDLVFQRATCPEVVGLKEQGKLSVTAADRIADLKMNCWQGCAPVQLCPAVVCRHAYTTYHPLNTSLMMTRRDMISISVKGAALVGLAGLPSAACASARNPYVLSPLPYPYGALEPHIDARTMEIHHSRHHQAYVTNLNAALVDSPLLGVPIDELMTRIDEVPDSIRQTVINNGGGHANHAFFWSLLGPAGSDRGTPGRFEPLLDEFRRASMSVFGSGWGWIVANADKQLEVMSTRNQDSPLMVGKTPILGVDVWEHAYYLAYQNRRADYVTAFLSVVNWNEVERRYREVM